jgi:PIN domain nuclease of toxin-antitoxin system
MGALAQGAQLADAPYLLGVAQSNVQASRFIAALSRTKVTAVNFGEVIYKLAERARRPPQQVAGMFSAQGVTVAPFELKAAMHFADLKRIDALRRAEQERRGVERMKPLSPGDMCCAA